MTRFWSSVLLKTGTYHGRPVPVHVKLTKVTEADFSIWLGLFRDASTATFEPRGRHARDQGHREHRTQTLARDVRPPGPAVALLVVTR